MRMPTVPGIHGHRDLQQVLHEQNAKVQDDNYNYFRGMLGFPPRVVRGEGLRIGVQMIAQRLNRSITEAAIEQLFDESLIDELENEGFFKSFRMK